MSSYLERHIQNLYFVMDHVRRLSASLCSLNICKLKVNIKAQREHSVRAERFASFASSTFQKKTFLEKTAKK